ncbi:MAG: ankyrin repeat domain-containing protein [Sulfuricella sp.]|nr:ankyrin repeat domain-containing protein [Sulfuricella sp.]
MFFSRLRFLVFFFSGLAVWAASAPVFAGTDMFFDDFLIAVRNGNVREVQAWLKRGADPNLRDERGETPLLQAVRADDNHEVVTVLLENRAKSYLRNPLGETALMLAAFFGRSQCVDVLLKSGTDIGEANRQGWTPLTYAAFAGHAEIVGKLLANGAAVNGVTANGLTPLMLAARNGHIGVVAKLLAAGADRSLKGGAGFTAEELAARAGNTEISKLVKP